MMMPLWHASDRQVGHTKPDDASLVGQHSTGGSCDACRRPGGRDRQRRGWSCRPQAVWPLSFGKSPVHRVEAGILSQIFAQGRSLMLSACLASC